ncbi:MAG: hypothetical protein ABW200_17700 [Hyphomicrobiaceae bacterium]|jgi:hypothetical protein
MIRSARFWKPALAAAGMVMISASAVTMAAAAGPFDSLNGSWSGAGSIRLDDGRTEGLKCKAYYSPRGGASMGLALRCASASNKIDLRATLNSTGSRIAGNWEERTFNVSGSASGQASGNAIKLAIDAGVLSGSMNVTTNGKSQTISVRTDGTGLRGVNINLSRD